jgi:ATP-dependent exoDNAse (exonuclease V) alpha subunit
VYDPVSKRVLAERLQYPLKPYYAMTIHKSQGITLELMVVNCSNAYIPGQIGVALGRVTSKKGLIATWRMRIKGTILSAGFSISVVRHYMH